MPDSAAANASLTLVCKETGRSWTASFEQVEALDAILSFDKENSVTVIDNRTGVVKKTEIINNEAISASIFSQIKNKGLPLRSFDPAYQNTAVVKSSISFVDGNVGILEYRGYSIEDLAEKSNFLEVSYLLIYGELPSAGQFSEWKDKVMKHTFVHTRMTELMKSFNYDAHPMGMFISAIAAMSTFHAEANPSLQGADIYLKNNMLRNKQIVRILGKAPTVAAAAYRHRIGRPYNLPQNHLDYTENFLYMLDCLSEGEFRPNKKLAKALDVMFILHADHEMNCSTAAIRHIGSSRTDPYSAVAGAAAALYGPLHGGANEAVLHMLEEIGTAGNVSGFLEQVKQKKKRLFGFGHRIYKSYDPRAKIIQKIAYDVFEVCGREPLIDIALALEREALADPYFKDRRLYPNVDFYSGLIYRGTMVSIFNVAMGFPTDFFPVLFAIPRAAGWLAHWNESMDEQQPKIWRPRQIYVGERKRKFVSMEDRRGDAVHEHIDVETHPFNRRYLVATRSKL